MALQWLDGVCSPCALRGLNRSLCRPETACILWQMPANRKVLKCQSWWTSAQFLSTVEALQVKAMSLTSDLYPGLSQFSVRWCSYVMLCRSKTQGIALSLGDKLILKQKGWCAPVAFRSDSRGSLLDSASKSIASISCLCQVYQGPGASWPALLSLWQVVSSGWHSSWLAEGGSLKSWSSTLPSVNLTILMSALYGNNCLHANIYCKGHRAQCGNFPSTSTMQFAHISHIWHFVKHY